MSKAKLKKIKWMVLFVYILIAVAIIVAAFTFENSGEARKVINRILIGYWIGVPLVIWIGRSIDRKCKNMDV